MIIEIKNKRYENPEWGVDNGIARIRVSSDKTFAEIAQDFVLEAGEIISQYNDDEVKIGEFYVEGMCSISLPSEDGDGKVTIMYHVSLIGKDAQDVITADLGDVADAVLEVCELIADLDTQLTNTCTQIDAKQKALSDRLDDYAEIQGTHTTAINRWEDLYNALADRVARLENIIGG